MNQIIIIIQNNKKISLPIFLNLQNSSKFIYKIIKQIYL